MVVKTGVLVGEMPKDSKVTNWAKETISPEQLKKDFDAVCADRRLRAEP